MKNYFTIALLLIWGISNAQIELSPNYNQSWSKRDKNKYGFITFGFDARNAVIGSKPTNDDPELNYHLKAGFVYNNIELGVLYEQFNRIDFQAYAATLGYTFQLDNEIEIAGILIPLDKTDIYVGAEAGSIMRYENFNFLMYGFNGEIRQHIGNSFILGLQASYRYRSDIDQKNGENDFRGSLMLNLTKKFN